MSDEPKITNLGEETNIHVSGRIDPKGDGKVTYHHVTNSEAGSAALDAINVTPLSLLRSREPSKLIFRLDDRVLLTIRREGDVFTADYDPADLDAAAALFVEEVRRQLGG